MQTHHLLSSLRLARPTKASELRRILREHDIFASSEEIERALELCRNNQFGEVVQMFRERKKRSRSMHKPYLRKLEPLVRIFDKMDALRSEGENKPDVSRLRFEAER